ncbi:MULTISPECIES: hypothetical protein [unclassified Streptomyces]|uniref:hypothetical protein n=1 Tax=Streptomyces sp. AM 3-1-1 TaxID=3028711 RepID=UPI0023B8D10A|nr:hypothetical protein [Streptomyces sp. AM 3-1-1]WEH26542.1 hypothetical protein P0D76_03980 [Streptomyces sp. AM 3-1-1]
MSSPSVLSWSMIAVALGFAGLAVLGVLGVRVWIEVRRLGLQVARTSQRISEATGDLERAATDLARTSGSLPAQRR